MTNYEKYFSTPERAAMTLCDLESEYQFAIRSGIKNNVEPLDENGKMRDFNDLMEDAAFCATHPLPVIFEWMGSPYVIDGNEERKERVMSPTTAHEFLGWLQEECDE